MLLWPDREADGSIETTTPSKIGVRDEMGRLEKVSSFHVYFVAKLITMQLVKKYDKGDMPKSDWLDAMAFRKMSEIHTVGHHHPQLYSHTEL